MCALCCASPALHHTFPNRKDIPLQHQYMQTPLLLRGIGKYLLLPWTSWFLFPSLTWCVTRPETCSSHDDTGRQLTGQWRGKKSCGESETPFLLLELQSYYNRQGLTFEVIDRNSENRIAIEILEMERHLPLSSDWRCANASTWGHHKVAAEALRLLFFCWCGQQSPAWTSVMESMA